MIAFDFDVNVVFTYTLVVSGLIWLTYLFYAKVIKKTVTEKVPALIEFNQSIFLILLVVILFRTILFEPFRVPTGSMIPTIKEGDFVLVSKFDYGINLIYPYHKILHYGTPKRGDVVVFRYPQDIKINYIKRLIGLPGDEITYNFDTNDLYINSELVKRDEVKDAESVEQSKKKKSVGLERDNIRSYVETIGKKSYAIQLYPNRFRCINKVFEEDVVTWQVPEGHYFVMGDNRIRSLDSRCWGMVPFDNLLGKGLLIFANWQGGLIPDVSVFRVMD